MALGRDCVVMFGCDCCEDVFVSADDFVVIVLVPDDVTVAFVVETCAAATKDPWDTASYVEVVLAWNVGLVRARKAEKKLAKKGRLVGMMSGPLEMREVAEGPWRCIRGIKLSYNMPGNRFGTGERRLL